VERLVERGVAMHVNVITNGLAPHSGSRRSGSRPTGLNAVKVTL
jgi:hypothetical protein